MNNYELDIISNHPDFMGKALKQYDVDGVSTVGSYGSEQFQIRFKNNTWSKVQVKISVDGTDVCTGETATSEPTGEMWSVAPYGTLTLKCWPESSEGGAAFVFTHAENSVAVHTHGDLSCRGIIAAAVFVEGEPAKTVEHHYHNYPWFYGYGWPYYWYNTPNINTPIYVYNGVNTSRLDASNDKIGYRSYSATVTPTSDNGVGGSASHCFFTSTVDSIATNSCDTSARESLGEVAPMCGAGEFVEQHISHVQGLVKPLLTETVKIKYMWWNELEAKLHEQNVPSMQPSGFPGDKPKGINLGNTPRIGGQKKVAKRVERVFSRV